MVEGPAATGASEPISVVTGGSKPVHRFLKGQPKCIGIVLVMMAVCLIMFGIAMNVQSDAMTSADMYTPFWLAILFFICGVLYILCERNPSKKIITASLALSIISTIGVFCACVGFARAITGIHDTYWNHLTENQTAEERQHLDQHYMAIEKVERVFFCHSLIGGSLLITMTFFARAALRSSRTQAVVVMRNLPSADGMILTQPSAE
ncbi:membrane-spanning 4-domains subfamily A member 4D isoform X2 [Rhinichthys klamathensis goyatoka]|uniref:membrane-spanning 4-domains subfamily A member 4D isoform X2 n=1 Tax=Rhinichthys klamathensis goyatoka TaxID=3034132 RepID=UPI0024B5B6CC|nr:membrane-spanning 4-domains subfamily A member 4D isoform X2 [Rhinichthys klamathensis goyatoka]